MTQDRQALAMNPNDEATIRESVRLWELAWNAGDMSAASGLFCDDADFVNVRGSHWHGRNEIASEHAIRHRLQLKGSIFVPLDVRVQSIGAGIALVHVRWKLSGDHDLDGTPRRPREGLFSWVMVKDLEGGWRIRSAHNTNIDASLALSPPADSRRGLLRTGLAAAALALSLRPIAASHAQSRPEPQAGFETLHIISSTVAGSTPDIVAAILPEAVLKQHRAAGRLRVLATSGPQRTRLMTDVPTLVEQGFARLVVQEWFAFFALAGVSPGAVEAASLAIRAAVAQPELAAAFADLGMAAVASTPADLIARIAAEQQMWAPLIRARGIRAE